MVNAVMAMYMGAHVYEISKAFNVKVGLHQGSVLSPLLFVIVTEIITKELGAGLSLELLYTDDLILTVESDESLLENIVQWNLQLEAKGLKMKTGNMEVMFECSMTVWYGILGLNVPFNTV